MKTIGYFRVHADETVTPYDRKRNRIRCPYQPMTYDEFGYPDPEYCGSWCPHFGDLEKEKGYHVAHLSCGGGTGALRAKGVVKG